MCECIPSQKSKCPFLFCIDDYHINRIFVCTDLSLQVLKDVLIVARCYYYYYDLLFINVIVVVDAVVVAIILFGCHLRLIVYSSFWQFNDQSINCRYIFIVCCVFPCGLRLSSILNCKCSSRTLIEHHTHKAWVRSVKWNQKEYKLKETKLLF